MKRQSIAGIIVIIGFALFIGGIAWMAAVGAPTSGGIGLLLFGLVVMVGGYVGIVSKPAHVKERIERFSQLRYEPITDYAAELEEMRRNFAEDAAPDKNTFKVTALKKIKEQFYDFSVINSGNIYYSALVEANKAGFKDSGEMAIIPAVVVYSTDEYYAKRPYELNYIAEALYEDKSNNLLSNEHKYFSNLLVKSEEFKGRKVYITTIMLYREYLPLCKITGWLLPVIANPENCPSVILTDCKYWTQKLIASSVYGNPVDNVQPDDDATAPTEAAAATEAQTEGEEQPAATDESAEPAEQPAAPEPTEQPDGKDGE